MIRNAKIGLAFCIPLIAVLGISSAYFYLRIENLQNQLDTVERDKINLQTWLASNETLLQARIHERNQLQTWLDGNITNYESQIQNLISQIATSDLQISSLEAQITNLQNEIDLLDSIYNDYVANHQYSNSEHWDYVYDHLYTNSEYDEACYSFYYVKPEEQRFGVYELDEELQALEWTEPYQANIFDCSEMSACLEWHLENRGWHAMIYCGDAPFGSGRHAWLIVETSEGGYMPVESTTLGVVWWSDPNFDDYWAYDIRFETIQDALQYSESQFDWWELGFSPLECN